MRRFGAQRGQTLPLVAVSLLVLVGTAGFAVDAGYHQYQQRMQQTATDSAALAAARELVIGDYVAAGRHDASINGYTDNTGGLACDSALGRVCVNIVSAPVAPDPFAGNSNAVEATITENHATFFEKVFGTSVVPVTTKAVAVLVNQASNLCLAVLDTTHTANFNATAGNTPNSLTAHNCGLQFNGGANFNNATVDAATINCAPSAASCSNGTFTQASPVTAAPVSDPCPAITYCAHLIADPPTCSSALSAPAASSSVTVPAGCYNGWTYHNSQNSPNLTVNLCGLYVLTGNADISSTGNSAPPITIQETSGCPGVTFYLTGGGQITFKNANMNLSAPTSGDYSQYTAGEQNVLFYQTTSDTNTAVLQSATCSACASTINGMMYFPSANVNYTKQTSSTSGNGTLIISYDLNCNGCEAGIFDAPIVPGLSLKIAVLGE